MVETVNVWMGDFGNYVIGPEWQDVKIRKDGWPDRRFGRGHEMVAHFLHDLPTKDRRESVKSGA